MLVFEEKGNQSTRRKPLGAEKRTNKLKPHMTPELEIKLGHIGGNQALYFLSTIFIIQNFHV